MERSVFSFNFGPRGDKIQITAKMSKNCMVDTVGWAVVRSAWYVTDFICFNFKLFVKHFS